MEPSLGKLEAQLTAHTRQDHDDFRTIHEKLDKAANEHPTNGELALMIKGVADDVTGVKEGVGEVKVQTTATNGRVTKLEAAKNMAFGGLVLTNIFIVPIGLALIINFLKK